jgi:hypothetical protein
MKSSSKRLLELILFSISALVSSDIWDERPSLRCRVIIVDTMYETPDIARVQPYDFACVVEADRLYELDLPKDFVKEHISLLADGTRIVLIKGAQLNDDTKAVELAEDADFTMENMRRLQDDFSSSMGQKSLFIVRVSVQDSEPTASITDLERLFDMDIISFRSQYNKCSFGKLDWVPRDIRDVFVNQSIAEFSDGPSLVTAAIHVLQTTLQSDYDVTSLQDVADKTLFCLPPGTGDWAASAGVNYYRAQFNNEWCTSLTALMHEVGHLIGLLHSNEPDETYGDQSGYMVSCVLFSRRTLRSIRV